MLTERLAHLAAQRDLLDVMIAQQYTPYANRDWQSGLDPALLLQMYVLDPDPVQHVAQFLKLWRPPYGAHVLDCGCGTGSFARLIQTQRPDLHWTLLGHNTDQLQHAARVAPCCHGDMHALPFAPGTFDAVLLCYALGYGYAPTVLGEVAQVLKPGGMCVLYDMVIRYDSADQILVSLGYKCYNLLSLIRYAVGAGLRRTGGGMHNLSLSPPATLHPDLPRDDTDMIEALKRETTPFLILWENGGTIKDTVCPLC